MTRSGFVALAGRPNVGKSTLVNAIVGRKVAIVSDKPQTTRRAIRGVATTSDWQMALVDLPGVQRPRDALTARMQRRVEQELADCDLALLVLDGTSAVGPGDRFLARLLGGAGPPVFAVVNKIDRLDRRATLDALAAAAGLAIADEIFPVAARTGVGVGALVAALAARLPAGEFLFGPEEHSDQPAELMLAELIREQVLRRTFQEVPHAVEIVIEEMQSPREDLVVVRALAWVETETQKAILVGARGAMIKSIGTAARRELERELGTRVHLDLVVRVRRSWRADEALLDRLGIE